MPGNVCRDCASNTCYCRLISSSCISIAGTGTISVPYIASLIISPIGAAAGLTCEADGLTLVLNCEQVQDCASDMLRANVGWTYDDTAGQWVPNANTDDWVLALNGIGGAQWQPNYGNPAGKMYQSAIVATTANIVIATALNPGDTIDGVLLAAGDRVLVKNQSAPAQNGMYVVDAAPFRSLDMPSGTQYPPGGGLVSVQTGSTQADTLWYCPDQSTAFNTGVTSMTWARLEGYLIVGGDLTGTVANAQYAAGSIVNADVNAAAAIVNSKLSVTTDFDMATHKIINVGDPVNPQDAATKTYVDTSDAGKMYRSVRAATTGNIAIATALNPGDAIDAVALAAGDRVLVKNQSAPAQNGIYIVDAVPFRAPDMPTGTLYPPGGGLVGVQNGATFADTLWFCPDTSSGFNTGVTAMTWTRLEDILVVGGDLTGTVGNAQLGAGVIVNADVNAAAAIVNSKLSVTTDFDMATHKVINVVDPTSPQHAATKAYVDATVATPLGLLQWKASVRMATIAAGALASSFENGDVVDGVVLVTGDRILIKDQAAPAENGIYTVNASGAPTRATDFDTSPEILGAIVRVVEGTVNIRTTWIVTAPITTFTVGVTPIAWGPYEISLNLGSIAGDVIGNVAFPVVKADAITNTKLADMAAATIKGRALGAGTGDPTDLTAAQTRTLLALVPGTNLPIYTTATGAPGGLGTNNEWYYDTAADRLYMSDGAGWIVMYEPDQTIAATTSNITLGTNGSVTHVYRRAGGICYCTTSIDFGTSGTPLSLTTSHLITPPKAAGKQGVYGAMFFHGSLGFGDMSINTFIQFSYRSSLAAGISGVSSTAPWVWGLNDFARCTFAYPMNTPYL